MDNSNKNETKSVLTEILEGTDIKPIDDLIEESKSPDIKPKSEVEIKSELDRDYELIDKVLETQQKNMDTWSPYFKKMIKWQIKIIFLIVIMAGFDFIPFKIDNNVIIILVTGIFAEAIGIVAIMIKYIYSNQVALLHHNRKNGNGNH